MSSPSRRWEVLRDLESNGLSFPYSALMEAADAQRHTAIVSRIPFERVLSRRALEFLYLGDRIAVKRGLQEVAFHSAGSRWYLFNIHLKSRRTERRDEPEARLRREAESRAIRNYIKKSFPPADDHLFLVMGDLNDTRDSLTVRQLLRSGQSALSEEVPVFDSLGEIWPCFYARNGTYSKVDLRF